MPALDRRSTRYRGHTDELVVAEPQQVRHRAVGPQDRAGSVHDEEHLSAVAHAHQDLLVVFLQGPQLGNVANREQALGEDRLECPRQRCRVLLRPFDAAPAQGEDPDPFPAADQREVEEGADHARFQVGPAQLDRRGGKRTGENGVLRSVAFALRQHASDELQMALLARREVADRMHTEVPAARVGQHEALLQVQEALQHADGGKDRFLGAGVADEGFAEHEQEGLDRKLALDLTVVEGHRNGGGGDICQGEQEAQVFRPVEVVGHPVAEAEDADDGFFLQDGNRDRGSRPGEEGFALGAHVLQPRVDQKLLFPERELAVFQRADEIVGRLDGERQRFLCPFAADAFDRIGLHLCVVEKQAAPIGAHGVGGRLHDKCLQLVDVQERAGHLGKLLQGAVVAEDTPAGNAIDQRPDRFPASDERKDEQDDETGEPRTR